MGKGSAQAPAVETNVPERLDRLPWSGFHWKILFALGVTWLLDGLEVTLKGAMSGVLQSPDTLGFSSADIGSIASVYLTGAVVGALLFGYLTDRFGRRLIFFVTLSVYLVGAFLTAFSWSYWSFAAFRFLTGLGIGGEYAAVNSAIDELIPARVRGHTDLVVNGTYWLGALLGAGATLLLLDPSLFPVDRGWRFGFGIGAVLGLVILFFRRSVPESPRWLDTHGRHDEAERITGAIEGDVKRSTGKPLPPPEGSMTLHPQREFGFGRIVRAITTKKYRRRALLGTSLMIAQAFLYNSIFFTYALVLTRFYQVDVSKTGLYLIPLAAASFLGPLALGRWFDTVGRRRMITVTYGISALFLVATGLLFVGNYLSAVTQTAGWALIFFVASAAASSAYLTVSEIFPLETRALAIAFFYAVGTAAGGIGAPFLLGSLIGTGSRTNVFYGYALGAALMVAAAVIELVLGVDAEKRSLEDVSEPLGGEAATRKDVA